MGRGASRGGPGFTGSRALGARVPYSTRGRRRGRCQAVVGRAMLAWRARRRHGTRGRHVAARHWQAPPIPPCPCATRWRSVRWAPL